MESAELSEIINLSKGSSPGLETTALLSIMLLKEKFEVPRFEVAFYNNPKDPEEVFLQPHVSMKADFSSGFLGIVS